jgi:ketosteroid isomerase-like protein
MSRENVEIVRRLIERANAHDVSGMLDLMSPDIVCFPAGDQPEARVLRGHDEFKQYLEGWRDAWGEHVTEVDELMDGGEYVVVSGRLVGRGRTSGIEVAAEETWLWRFRDGKAIEYRECRTKANALEAAGLREKATSEENIDVVRRMLGAFNRGAVPAVVSAFDENCEIDAPPEVPDRPPVGFRGHDGVREWMANLRDVTGIQFEPVSFTTNGDAVLWEWASRGVGQASGVPVEWTTFVVIHMRGGKIVRAQGFFSRDEALEAAGLRESRR